MNKKAIIVSGVLFGSLSAIFVRMANAPSLILVLYRSILSVLLLTPVVLMRNREELKHISIKMLMLCCLSGIVLGLHFTVYFESLLYTSITASSTLSAMEVFFVAFALILFFKEKISGRAWLGIILAFAGSALIALLDTSSGSDALKGNMLALLAGFLMAVYTLIGKVCRKTLTTNAYTYIVYLASTVTVLLISLASKTPILGYGEVNWLCALGLAVFCTLLGHSIYSWGLKYVQASFISNAKMLTPVFATMFGIIFFREYPSTVVICGSLLAILGVFVYSKQINAK